MTERTVTVHLNAAVSRYLRNMKASEEQTARVRRELRGLREEAQHLTRGGLIASIAGLPGLLSPVGAALVALPGLAAGAAASFGSLAVALHGTGDALQAVNKGDPEKLAEAMNKLSVSAKAFISEYQRVRPTLSLVRQATQEAFFRQLIDDLDRLTSTYLPTLLSQLPKMAAAMGKAGHEMVSFATAPETVKQINRQIALATELTDDWARFLKASLGIVLDLADAGADFNRGLVKGLADGAESLRRWISQRVAMGDMNRMLDNGALVLSKLGDVAQEAGELLFDMMANPALADASAVFLEVLHSGLAVIHGLLTAFSALPGPMQSTVATLVAVGGAAMLVAGQFARLRASGLAMQLHLKSTGLVGEALSTGMERLGRHVRRAAIAFTALQVAGSIADSLRDAAPGVDVLTEAVLRFVFAGEQTRVFVEQFGADMEQMRKDVARANMRGLEDMRKGAGIEGLFGDAPSMFTSRSNKLVLERLTSTDQALAQMVRSGNATAAAALLRDAGVSAQQAATAFPTYTAALEGTSAAQAQVTMTATAMGKSHELAILNAARLEHGLAGVVDVTGSFAGAFERIHGGMLAFGEAEIVMEESLDRLAESFERNGKTMDITNEKGRENKRLMFDSVQAAVDLAQKKYDETVATQGHTAALREANGVYQANIAKLRDAMIAAGLNKDAVNALLKKYAEMPPLISTTITANTSGLDSAISKLRQIQNMARDARIDFATRNRWGGIYENRWGGAYVHAQSGVLRDAGIYSPRSPARYAFAEPGTGGEAFVPRFGDYDRSMSILSKAAGWYGASVVPGGGGGMQTVVHEHRHIIVIQGRELLSGFRRDVNLAGGKTDNLVGRKRA